MRTRRLAAVWLGCGVARATADPVADFYAGKAIQLIISTGVGGGVDTNARIFARHFGDHVPGHPTIVPQNMTGAGHLQATNYLYNAAPRDGTAIGVILAAFVGYQALDGKGAKYDARKFNWLGSSDVDNANLYTWRGAGVTSIEDTRTKPVLMGATGAGSYTMLYPTLLNNVFGAKFKIVAGYKARTRSASRWSVARCRAAPAISSRACAQAGRIGCATRRSTCCCRSATPATPIGRTRRFSPISLRTPDERRVYDVFSAEIALGRPFVTTPVLPADRLDALRRRL